MARLASVLIAALVTLAAAGEEAPWIEEVVVTAAKREQGLYDVPVSLSVFDGGEIEERGIADLVDVGKFVPNLTVTAFGAGHTASANPFIRGIGTQDHLITTDPGVGVYVDGVYLGRQIGQHWNLANVERVEVLRGPQGTLYGRNSVGGAINIVTGAPGADPGTRASIRLGARRRINARVHHDSNPGDTVGFSASAGVDRRAGIGRFVNLPDTDAEVGHTRELAARLAVAWRPSDAFTLTVVADANDGDNGLNPYTTLIDEVPGGAVYAAGYRNADVARNPYDNNTGQADQATTTNAAQGLAATAHWALAERLTARAIASIRRSEYRAGLDDDSFFDDYLSFPERGEADQISLEAQLHGDFGGADWVAGIYRFGEDGANRQPRTVFLGFPGAFALNQEIDSTAVFANIERTLAERWRFGIGVRATRDRKKAVTDVGTGSVRASRAWEDTSWNLAIHYAANERRTFYGTIQSGYQSGQFPARPYCLFGDPNCFVAGDNITALNYEVGFKGQPAARLELRTAVFHTRYDDLPYQVSTTAGQGFNTVNLIVEQRTSGVEWESRLYVGGGFMLHAAIGYLDVQLARQQGVRPVAPLTPELTVSISPEYRRALPGGGEISGRFDYSHRDAMWGEPSADPGRLTGIPSRRLVNFHVGYTAPGNAWSAAIYGRNAGDARYDHARLNTGDYLLRILSNDASEFGIRLERRL